MGGWYELLRQPEVDGVLHVGFGLAARTVVRYTDKDDGCATRSCVSEYQKCRAASGFSENRASIHAARPRQLKLKTQLPEFRIQFF